MIEQISEVSEARRELLLWLEGEASLMELDKLRDRLDVLDRLDACFPQELEVDTELIARVEMLRTKLEAANETVYAAIRSEIQHGENQSLLRWMQELREEDCSRKNGYGPLDELLSGVLGLDEPLDEEKDRDAEMVFYQPTPARVICELMDAAQLQTDDVLVDLGSGMGHVPLVVSLCTKARGVGVEREPTYVDCARRCVERLRLQRVSFEEEDARLADLSTGTVFYLYTPFTGSILRDVLDRLKRESERRKIRVCAYGPVAEVIAQETWLEDVGGGDVKVFVSRV